MNDKIITDLTEEAEEEMIKEHQKELETFKNLSLKEVLSALEDSLKKTDLIVDALNSLPTQVTEIGAIMLVGMNDNRMAVEIASAWIEHNCTREHEDNSENAPTHLVDSQDSHNEEM